MCHVQFTRLIQVRVDTLASYLESTGSIFGGAMNKKYDIHKGDRFCSLVVASEEPIKIEKWGAIRTAFECECECGGKIVVTGYDLLKGRIKSCGCKKGNPKSPYGTWKCEVCGSIFRSRKTL